MEIIQDKITEYEFTRDIAGDIVEGAAFDQLVQTRVSQVMCGTPPFISPDWMAEQSAKLMSGSRGQVVFSPTHNRMVALVDEGITAPLAYIVYPPLGQYCEYDFWLFYEEREAIDKAEAIADDEWGCLPEGSERPKRPNIYALWPTGWPDKDERPTTQN